MILPMTHQTRCRGCGEYLTLPVSRVICNKCLQPPILKPAGTIVPMMKLLDPQQEEEQK